MDELSIECCVNFEDWTWEDPSIPNDLVKIISVAAARLVTDEICRDEWINITARASPAEVTIDFMALGAELIFRASLNDLIDSWISDRVYQSGDRIGHIAEEENEVALILIKALETTLASIKAVL